MDSAFTSLCTAGCGFYGNSQFGGMCSQCFKKKGMDVPMSQPKPAMMSSAPSAPAAQQLGVLDANAQLCEGGACALPASLASIAIPSIQSAPSTPVKAALAAEAPIPPTTPSTVSKPKLKCQTCKLKVGLLGFTCRCEMLLCAQHRHADQHACTFDYKTAGRLQLEKLNPAVIGEKIRKI